MSKGGGDELFDNPQHTPVFMGAGELAHDERPDDWTLWYENVREDSVADRVISETNATWKANLSPVKNVYFMGRGVGSVGKELTPQE